MDSMTHNPSNASLFAPSGSALDLVADEESPRLDFLIAEIRTALSFVKMGLRSDDSSGQQPFHVKMTFDESGVSIIPLPEGQVHSRFVLFLESALVDFGLDVSRDNLNRLFVRETKRLSMNIH